MNNPKSVADWNPVLDKCPEIINKPEFAKLLHSHYVYNTTGDKGLIRQQMFIISVLRKVWANLPHNHTEFSSTNVISTDLVTNIVGNLITKEWLDDHYNKCSLGIDADENIAEEIASWFLYLIHQKINELPGHSFQFYKFTIGTVGNGCMLRWRSIPPK